MCMYILMFFHDVAANQFYQTQLHAHLDSVWFRLAFVCMRLQQLLFDLYVMIPGQTRLHRLSISFGTYIQLHNFARFLLGKKRLIVDFIFTTANEPWTLAQSETVFTNNKINFTVDENKRN